MVDFTRLPLLLPVTLCCALHMDGEPPLCTGKGCPGASQGQCPLPGEDFLEPIEPLENSAWYLAYRVPHSHASKGFPSTENCLAGVRSSQDDRGGGEMALICDRVSVLNPVVSFSRATPEGLRCGHQVTVKGMFLPSCGSRFAVDFQTGFSDNDIAFHFNPRFEEGGYVACNTKQKGQWGTEERMMPNPFLVGVPFEISFLVENSGFKVTVNGKDFTKYKHLVPFHRVDTISFTGGVEVTQISIEDARAVSVPRMIPEVQFNLSPNSRNQK